MFPYPYTHCECGDNHVRITGKSIEIKQDNHRPVWGYDFLTVYGNNFSVCSAPRIIYRGVGLTPWENGIPRILEEGGRLEVPIRPLSSELEELQKLLDQQRRQELPEPLRERLKRLRAPRIMTIERRDTHWIVTTPSPNGEVVNELYLTTKDGVPIVRLEFISP